MNDQLTIDDVTTDEQLADALLNDPRLASGTVHRVDACPCGLNHEYRPSEMRPAQMLTTLQAGPYDCAIWHWIDSGDATAMLIDTPEQVTWVDERKTVKLPAPPRARAGDKPSSHEAAHRIAVAVPERAALFCYALDRIGGHGTANEVAAHLIDTLGWVHWSTGPWKRATDCERLGLIHPQLKVGDGPSESARDLVPVYRRCSVTGHRAMVWELKATGRDCACLIVPVGSGYRYEPEGKQWQT